MKKHLLKFFETDGLICTKKKECIFLMHTKKI